MVAVNTAVSSGIILEIEGHEKALLNTKKTIKDTLDLSNSYVNSIFALLLI